jgi:hypothetical protein
MEASSKRTRMNLAHDSKGFVKFDITAEYETPEETAIQLGKAIDLVQKTAKDHGLKLVGPVEVKVE